VEAFGAGGRHFADKETLIAALRADLQAGATCLVKGSHSSGMDQVVAALKNGPTKEGAHDAA
jgi:UDP-N-acetylmuramoyl-tripeptide--D-alanyl-D-alanine ligase